MTVRSFIITFIFSFFVRIATTRAAYAQENIDEMLAVVERNVITQSDIQVLSILNRYHVPESVFLHERSTQDPIMYLVEMKILDTLANAVPIYNLSIEKENYIHKLLPQILSENHSFPYHDRVGHWLRTQLIAENYVRINLGLSKTNNGSLSAYLRWVQDQKYRVPHRIVRTEEEEAK